MKRLDWQDVAGFLGLALIVAGLTRWSLSLGLIVAGAMLFMVAYLTAKPGKQKR